MIVLSMRATYLVLRLFTPVLHKIRHFEAENQPLTYVAMRSLDDTINTNHTMGYFIHILLVIAIVVVLVRIIQGRRPV
jgi:hypothetical protein